MGQVNSNPNSIKLDNMTTFRLKFAIRIIKKFMGESPNVLLVL